MSDDTQFSLTFAEWKEMAEKTLDFKELKQYNMMIYNVCTRTEADYKRKEKDDEKRAKMAKKMRQIMENYAICKK